MKSYFSIHVINWHPHFICEQRSPIWKQYRDMTDPREFIVMIHTASGSERWMSYIMDDSIFEAGHCTLAMLQRIRKAAQHHIEQITKERHANFIKESRATILHGYASLDKLPRWYEDEELDSPDEEHETFGDFDEYRAAYYERTWNNPHL
jgi:hypothetical protein